MPDVVLHPEARVADLIGILLTLNNVFDGSSDLADLEEELEVDLDELMPIVYAASAMGFIAVGDGYVAITDKGKDFIAASIEKRKEMLRESLKSVEPFKTAMELKSFTVEELQSVLEKKGYPTYSGPTGLHDLEVILTEWGVYSKLLKRVEDKYVVNE